MASNPRRRGEGNLRDDLARTRIAADLLDAIVRPGGRGPRTYPVLIEANAHYPGGAKAARLAIARAYVQERRDVMEAVARLAERGVDLESGARTAAPGWQAVAFHPADQIDLENSFWTAHFLICRLTKTTILKLGRQAPDRQSSPVYKLWLNHTVETAVFESARTVKCDAARAAFGAAGEGVVWAVADTGIDGGHPHFATHATLDPPKGLAHHDFTGGGQPLSDGDGHGTHVAGIIAGETLRGGRVTALAIDEEVRISDGQVETRRDMGREVVTGVAPRCKLLSLKVLSGKGAGDVGLLLAAIGYIQEANNGGRDLKIHGLNLSLGYVFDATWFAAGASPLCVEVNRLVKSGVVVVVAAGNGGYGSVQTLGMKAERATHLGTINDPGNADLAITVGSTHRDMPHRYGVSYFSGKGPTADGRMKPDLVAPGERIVSCAPMAQAKGAGEAPFCERSGTSMAAPHVSGVVAAFLSARREFKGEPQRVKAIMTTTATDLGRRPEFQGAGLIDAMRALQSV